MNRLERTLEFITSGTLVVAGLISILITVADLVKWELPTKPSIQILLTLVGLLSLGIGLERVLQFRRYDEHLKQIESQIVHSTGGHFCTSYPEVYEAGKRLVNRAENEIRDIIFGFGVRKKAPPEWLEVAAQKIRSSKLAGATIKFEVIEALDLTQLPSTFKELNIKHSRIFERYGVRDALSLYLLNMRPAIGFDLLIIDREHLIINLTPLGGEETQKAILFENQPQLASAFANWFDRLLRQTTPYEEWLQEPS